jgi:hypothetical protein
MSWKRLAIVVSGMVLLGAAAWQLREGGPGGVPLLPGCIFRRFTGLACPGCGMTRAAFHALNGRLGQAFAMNPLGMVLLPVALAALVPEVMNWVRLRPRGWSLRPGRRLAGAIAVAVIVFWIWRNTPWWPLQRV